MDKLEPSLITVIIPYFNQANLIESVIFQHLNQSLPPHEIIVVDDGSTDDGIKRARNLQNKYSTIRIESIKKNMGVNAAINHGLSLVRSPFVKLSACDDLVEPNLLEIAVSTLLQYPRAAFCFSFPGEYFPKIEKKYAFPLNLSQRPVYLSPSELVLVLRKRCFSFPSNSCVFRTAALKDVGLFRAYLELGADWFACFAMAFRYGVCFLPQSLTWFCMREDSYSATGLKDKRRQLETLKHILDLMLEPEFRELKYCFKKSAVVYEYSFHTLIFLLKNPQYYPLLSFKLFKRLTIRSTWSYIRRTLSINLRQKINFLRNCIDGETL